MVSGECRAISRERESGERSAVELPAISFNKVQEGAESLKERTGHTTFRRL